jgi:type I restriction enzyme S subunit
MKKWHKRRLRDIADLCLGKMLDEQKNRGEPLPYLANINVRWGEFELDDLRQMRFEADEKERYGLKNGDIAMCEGGEPGRCAIWKEQLPEMMIQKALHRIRPHDCVDHRFLYYSFLQTGKLGGFAPLFTGSTIKHLTGRSLANLEIELPDLATQARIGSTLSAYDDLIQNNRRRMALLENAARVLCQEWFIRLRFPGYEHIRIAKGTPQGWERKTAHEALEILSGGTPKTSVTEFWGGEIPFYTPKDAPDGIWVTDCDRTITEVGLSNCNSRLFPKETVFISARGTVGKLNMAQRPMAMSQSCYALVGKGHLTQPFVFCAMQEGVAALRQQAVGAVFDAIIVDTFKRISFLIPPPKTVRLFDEFARPVLAQLENLTLQNQKLRAARDLLLPRLMSGELTV